MKITRRQVLGVLTGCLLWSATCLPALAGWGDFIKGAMDVVGDSGELTDSEIVRGLKQALEIGTQNAVGYLSRENGFYSNPEVKIPLPGPVEKAKTFLQMAGFDEQVDAFELSMNRAAERAVPEATDLFMDAIGQMTFDDAKTILTGSENEATRYFQNKTSDRLAAIFQPLVNDSMNEVGVTRTFQSLNDRLRTIPFAEQMSFDLGRYVTERTLDGLFLILAREEAKIRQDPSARTTELLRKVFSSR